MRRGTHDARRTTGNFDNRGFVGGGVSKSDNAALEARNIASRPPRGAPLFTHSVIEANSSQVPGSVLSPRANQILVVEIVVGMQTELPVRVRESSRTGVERTSSQASHPCERVFIFIPVEALGAVEIRPTRRIVNVNEIAVEGPSRFIDADLRAVN